MKDNNIYVALGESTDQYKNLIQSLPVAVYTCDKDGLIQIYNQAAVALWGREPKEGKDRWCGSWKIFNLDGSEVPLDNCPMAVTLQSGNPVSGIEAFIERPNGERRFVQPYPQIIYDENGAITGAINTLIDITEIRQPKNVLPTCRNPINHSSGKMKKLHYPN